MVEIQYSSHLNLRLKIRQIPHSYPKKIYEEPEQTFFDTAEKTNIAVKKLMYNAKLRNMMIAYEQRDYIIEIITIHPIRDEQIMNRQLTRRWIKNG